MMESLIKDWQDARKALRAIEESEHPDITDGYGRVWVWKSGDLYTHDATLARPLALIHRGGLPSPALASNPNYSKLCDICTKEWENA